MKSANRLEGGRYRPLQDQDIKAIHETSMRVFSEVGIKVKNKEALNLFASAGAKVNFRDNLVKMEPECIIDLINKAPEIIRLYGQRPKHTLEVGGKSVYTGTGGTALYVVDYLNKKKRPAVLSDLKDIARVVDSLRNIHFFMLPVLPHDVDKEHMDINRFGVALAHCSKHITGGVYTLQGIRSVIKMAEVIAGSPKKLKDKPIISMVTCCSISPFVLDNYYTQLTIEVAKAGIPLITPVEPLCGATSPVTLAGNLVVQNCDTLTGVMLIQIINPGTPVFYGCISSIADLRDMKYLSGAIEMGLMNAVASQLARFYKLPLLKNIGPGGHFVASRHTRSFMRREQYIPNLCDRSKREEWITNGAKTLRQRARQKVKAILSSSDTPVFPERIREKIKSEIKGIDMRFI